MTAMTPGDAPTIDALFDDADLSPSTARVYRAGWRDFHKWFVEVKQVDEERRPEEETGPEEEGQVPLPAEPETVAEFIQNRHQLARSTLRNRLSAIRYVHRRLDLGDPTSSRVVQKAWDALSEMKRKARTGPPANVRFPEWPPQKILTGGVELLLEYFNTIADDVDRARGEEARTRGDEEAPTRLLEERKQRRELWRDPFIDWSTAGAERMTSEQRALLPPLKYDLVILRDRALLLLMAAGGARRSEVVRMDVGDVVFDPDSSGLPGALLAGLRKSNGMPKRVLKLPQEEDVEACTARAVVAWIVTAQLFRGPLFRSFDAHENLKQTRISPSTINLIIDRRAEAVELDPEDWTTSRLRKEPSDA